MDAQGAPASLPESGGTPTLLATFQALCQELGCALCVGRTPANAFLIAAGLHQIVQDLNHRDFLASVKVAQRLGGSTRLLLPVSGAARHSGDAAVRLRARLPRERGNIARERLLEALVGLLAREVVDEAATGGQRPMATEIVERAKDIATRALGHSDTAPLDREVLRPPNCFRGFDQRPHDFLRLAEQLARRHTRPGRPIQIVGLRTSGNYVGPLLAGYLRRMHCEAEAMTIRPGYRLLSYERERLDRARSAGAAFVVVDDPPRTGAQVLQAVEQLRAMGVPRGQVVLALALFTEDVPPAFDDIAGVFLPWSEWEIHRKLAASAVQNVLGELVASQRSDPAHAAPVLRQVSRTAPEPTTTGAVTLRGHARAEFEVVPSSPSSHLRPGDRVHVEGVGYGYFGEQAAQVAGALHGWIPTVYGVRDGLLYRASPPLRRTVRMSDPGPSAQWPLHVAAYVHARARALALGDDVTQRVTGREAAWEHAAGLLSDGFGRFKQVVRPLTHAAGHVLVGTAAPSLIDGCVGLAQWTCGSEALESLKTDFLTGPFSRAGLYSCDAVFDLADAAAEAAEQQGPAAAEALRRALESISDTRIDDERWLLYRLLHHNARYAQLLAALRNDQDITAYGRLLRAERAMALAFQHYLGEKLLRDVEPPTTGPICALDVDGVLETRLGAFPAGSPASALALRGLLCHGWRPVISTGRSLEEVRGRCAAYRLGGGVAEYGSVIYDPRGTRHLSLLDDTDRAALAEVRAVLTALPRVHLDDAYQHSVRAHTIDERGRRASLPAAVVDRVLADSGVSDHIGITQSPLQTDFIAAGIDKGRGLRALLGELGIAPHSPEHGIAAAVGDSLSDLPMLELAERPYAVANAATALNRRMEVLRQPYGSGVFAAVTNLLGHRPGSCDTCAPPARTPNEDVLLSALGALDGGAASKARAVAALSVALYRAQRRRDHSGASTHAFGVA